MVLSDTGIQQALKAGHIEIDPHPVEYSTSAVDLFLGDEFQNWDIRRLELPGIVTHLDLAEHKFPLTAAEFLKEVPRERDGSVIFPPYKAQQAHMLAITRERVNLKIGSRLAGRVEGRSALARYGLMIHVTAPTIHAGFNGHITLELVNLGPFNLKLVPRKTRICQLIIERVESDPSGEFNSVFQGQTKPSGAA